MRNLFDKTKQRIISLYPQIQVRKKDECVLLEGELEKWEDVIQAGYMAAKAKSEGVINNIKLKNYISPAMRVSPIKDRKYDGLKCAVLIIGGGIVGASILREFSKYNIDVCLIEKESDVALHASSRNDSCIHVGMDLSRNSKKHHYLRRAVKVYKQLAKDLGVEYVQHGQTLVFNKRVAYLAAPILLSLAKKKGIQGARIIKRKELLKKEPNISKDAKFAVFFP
ncbi:MAG: FAD-dependent oxidoreductase, partial [Bacilli bacterium]|nr:FAD-dependent oxidoreductase [Bacilli bacterium]